MPRANDTARWKPVAEALKKFSIKDLLSTVTKLELFPANIQDLLTDFKDARRKNDILKVINKAISEYTDSATALGHISLLYCYLRSSTRVWTIFKLIIDDDDFNEHFVAKPEELQIDLQRELAARELTTDVAVQLHDGAYWFRIYAADGERIGRRRIQRTSTTFCVHFQGTNCIAVAGFNKWHSSHIFEVLGGVLNFTETEMTSLQDRNVMGIIQLFSDKGNPFFHLFKQLKHPFATSFEKSKELDQRIKHIEKDKMLNRKRYIETNFGTVDIPPLKKLVYEIHTPFSGLEYAAQMNVHESKLFQCQAVMEGEHVIDGLQSMITAGNIKTPLPPYLSKVRTAGKTKFLVKTAAQNRSRS